MLLYYLKNKIKFNKNLTFENKKNYYIVSNIINKLKFDVIIHK